MTPKRFARLCATLDRRQPDLTVLTDQVHKPHNLSAIIRTCDAVGIHRIHVVGDEITQALQHEAMTQGDQDTDQYEFEFDDEPRF